MFYTAEVTPHLVPLDDNEIKMLLVAIRQVQHTFAIADAQGPAGGEPVTGGYDSVREAYAELHSKLSALAGLPPAGPRLVK